MRFVLHVPDPLAPGLPRMMTLSFAAHGAALVAVLVFPVFGPRPAPPAWDDVLVGALLPDLPPGAAAGPPPAATAGPAPAPAVEEPPPPAPEEPPPPPPPEEPAKPAPPKRERPKPTPPKPEPREPTPRPAETSSPAGTTGGSSSDAPATGGSTSAGPTGAASGAGGSSVGAAFDVGAFPFAYYRAVLETKLQAAWQRPMFPQGATDPIPVGVRFRIRRDGSVEDVAVDSPSPMPALDASAMRAVYSAAPFPPLPAQFTGDSLGVSIRFTLAP